MNTTSPAIRLDDVWLSRRGGLVLESVSFELEEGRFAALIGPNGAGKTTCLRLLLGLIKPSRGSVEVFGRPPGRLDRPLGYVPQRVRIPHGFPLTVREMVLMGRYGLIGIGRRAGSDDYRAVDAALDKVGLSDMAGRRYQDLSGGQQQRALIARALVGEPLLLLLDEPTASLDAAARARFYTLVCDLQHERGLTLLVASHDLEDVALHADVLFLLDGTLRASGPPTEVLDSPELARAFAFPPPHTHGSVAPGGDQS